MYKGSTNETPVSNTWPLPTDTAAPNIRKLTILMTGCIGILKLEIFKIEVYLEQKTAQPDKVAPLHLNKLKYLKKKYAQTLS